MFKFGLKSVAEARLKDTILAAIEYQSQAELARIFAGLAGLLQRPYEQDAVMLLSAGYDALVSTTDGGSTQSRSWFELGPVCGTRDDLLCTNPYKAGRARLPPGDSSADLHMRRCAAATSF